MKEDLGRKNLASVIAVLREFLSEGDRLNRFFDLTNGVSSSLWVKWLQSSLLLERYATQKGDIGLVNDLRSARYNVANRMLEVNVKLNWVSCVLDGSGVFEVK
jgi:hypothetical protein